jgi:hypothetical protein
MKEHKHEFWVYCGCEKMFYEEEDALKAWNTRAGIRKKELAKTYDYLFKGVELNQRTLEMMLDDVKGNRVFYKGFKYYHRPIRRIFLAVGVLLGKCMCVYFKRER